MQYILREIVQKVEWHCFPGVGIGFDIDYSEALRVPGKKPALQVTKNPIYTILKDTMMTEERVRFQMRIDPGTDRKVKVAMPLANCQNQNEFVETALRGTIQDTENRICRLLFTLAVEQDMMMNVMAAGMGIDEETLSDLRGHCVDNVKKTNGSVTLEGAVRFQKGG